MKKNILIAIILCVFNSVAAFAQTEKEYSMIISLQNGSTVTLGHNDIKNITFTGDKINAEGNVVTTIEENYKMNLDQESRLYKHEDYLNTLDVRNAETRLGVEENQHKIEENQARTAYLESRIKDLQVMIEDLQAIIDKQNAKISELENKLNEK